MTEKSDIEEVQKLIEEILKKCADGKYIFRGTTEIYSNRKTNIYSDELDGISSSLYRWAIKQGVKFHSNFRPMDIEKEIVEKSEETLFT